MHSWYSSLRLRLVENLPTPLDPSSALLRAEQATTMLALQYACVFFAGESAWEQLQEEPFEQLFVPHEQSHGISEGFVGFVHGILLMCPAPVRVRDDFDPILDLPPHYFALHYHPNSAEAIHPQAMREYVFSLEGPSDA